MKVILARSAGFCSGVQSAIIKISKSLNRFRSIGIDGDLIHNPQTTQALRNRGLVTLLHDDSFCGPVAIRTHGTSEKDLRDRKKKSSKLINLTCPKVSRVQGIIKKHARDGFHVIITGDDQHAEVLALRSYATSGSSVINKTSDIDNLPKGRKYLLVSQTTFEKDRFAEIRTYAERRIPGITVISTICDSTFDRQNELIDAIDKGIDTLIVIGGKKSANTRSLASIGQTKGITTSHIETADELSLENIRSATNLFITAGASTPRWIIDAVLEKITMLRMNNAFRFLPILYIAIRSPI
ncbi:MAG TPA: 4-hydroxy-3-methylbut-2-enyl diphosphate reductase, partial [Spirochaetota bacterium]